MQLKKNNATGKPPARSCSVRLEKNRAPTCERSRAQRCGEQARTIGRALLAVFLLASLSYAVTVQLQAPNTENLRDAYVSMASPNTNYGSRADLQVRNHGTQARRSYFMFDISAVPAGVFISDARLCLYLYSDGGTASTSAYHVFDSTWDGRTEETITWNNQVCGTAFNDATDCNLTAESTVTTTGTGWKCWNVTNAVRAEYAGGGKNVSIALKSPETASQGADTYRSKEYTTPSERPYLNITYSDTTPPSVTNATPAAGASFPAGSAVAISAIVTDNVAVDSVKAQVEFPNGTKANYSLAPSGSNYSINFTSTSAGGRYNITFYANDTSNNLNDSVTTWFSVTVAPPSVSTDKSEYSNCGRVYYRVTARDVNGTLVNANLTISVYNSTGGLENMTGAATGNGGTGIYNGFYDLLDSAPIGRWLLSVAAQGASASAHFYAGSGGSELWKIEPLEFTPDSLAYADGTPLAVKFRVLDMNGNGVSGLNDASTMNFNIDGGSNLAASVSDEGSGWYNYSFTASGAGSHYVSVQANASQAVYARASRGYFVR